MAEVPARFLPGMVEQLAGRLLATLGEARLAWAGTESYGAPRRVAIIVRGLTARQPDREVEVRGPAAKAAFGSDGAHTQAALGFARAQGVPPEGLVRREVGPGNEYVFARKVEAGQDAGALLPGILAGVLGAMQFPRNMRWGDYEFHFVRPIRWLLCLFGSQPIKVVLPGLPAAMAEPAGQSRGHRFLLPGAVHIETPSGYLDSLRTAGVIADAAERRDLIVRGAKKAAAGAGGEPVLEPALVDELVWLAEHPTPVLGSFDASFLELPEEALVTVMQRHQRFLAVREPGGGKLMPLFVGVRDGGREHLDTVRHGYELVLRARLADARFFFAEDRRRTLASRRPDLGGLVYHERLGSVAAKTERLVHVTGAVAAGLGLAPGEAAAAVRAAELAKCDLVTQMVRELPELQGVMGCAYARLDGELEAVAAALAEQYLPAGDGTATPSTRAGLALSVADKLDALVGYFWAGVKPTGSNDPYGMRRAASGIVAALIAQGAELDLARAVTAAGEAYAKSEAAGKGRDDKLGAAMADAVDLLRARVAAALAEGGAAHDEVEAVLGAAAIGLEPVRLAAAGAALGRVREEEWFRRMCQPAVRAAGLGAKAKAEGAGEQVDPAAFESPVEGELWRAYQQVAASAATHLRDARYVDYWRQLVPLREPLDRFFDGVLVMAPDARVRRNRLTLCHLLHQAYAAAADLSRLVWAKETAPGH
jgi:glycyl-tRNA synthetase beta chain